MHEISRRQGFELRTLRNDRVEIACAPSLGAKVISLKNLVSGREWMWRPKEPDGADRPLRLFANQVGDDFAASTMVGWDECIPTIALCVWKGRRLPDHGEAWSAPWDVDEAQWRQDILKTSVRLAISPFRFERTIKLKESEICISYSLSNLGAETEYYLWSMHPLLHVGPGDRIETTAEVCSLLGAPAWLDTLDLADRNPAHAKVYASGMSRGHAAAVNDVSGDRLDFDWDAAENPVLGLWLTRGGWNGHHHMAIEPTNAAADSLADANDRCGKIAAGAAKTWSVRLRVSP